MDSGSRAFRLAAPLPRVFAIDLPPLFCIRLRVLRSISHIYSDLLGWIATGLYEQEMGQ